MEESRASLLVAGAILMLLLEGCGYSPAPKDRATETTQTLSPLTAKIRPGSDRYLVRGINSVTIRFHNAGPNPVSILKPLDGSEWGWHMPYYRLIACDAEGHALELCPRCGNSGLWADSEWPRDYLVPIKPKANYEIEVALPYAIKEDGRYTVSFEYVYQPENERFPAPPGAWRGAIAATAVALDLKREH